MSISENVDLGPAKTFYGGTYLGETSGETTWTYELETTEIDTEESGRVDEVVTGDPSEVSVPILETDIDHLETIIPWAKIIGSGDSRKLVVGNAIGTQLSKYAKPVRIHPKMMGEDLSRDVNIFRAYPVPGPLEFSYSREGQRVANVTFKLLKDPNKPEDENYYSIGPGNPICQPVTAEPGSGDYDTAQDVTLSTPTTGTTIYYTVDGSAPTTSSNEYTGAITVDSPQVIKAIATKTDYQDSEVEESYYVGSLTV